MSEFIEFKDAKSLCRGNLPYLEYDDTRYIKQVLRQNSIGGSILTHLSRKNEIELAKTTLLPRIDALYRLRLDVIIRIA